MCKNRTVFALCIVFVGFGVFVKEFDDRFLVKAIVELQGNGKANHERLAVVTPAVEVYLDAY